MTIIKYIQKGLDEGGLSKSELKRLVDSLEEDQFFFSEVDENNSAAFGLIPESVYESIDPEFIEQTVAEIIGDLTKENEEQLYDIVPGHLQVKIEY